jgi:hypothetical protein
MTEQHTLIVSVENNPYMSWQSKLLHFSGLSRLEQIPVFIVHESGTDLHPGFQDILNTGGEVFVVPNYKRTRHGDDYGAKNLAGTVFEASSLCAGRNPYLLLLDPDMLFVRQPILPKTLSGDFCSYINFDREFAQTAARVFGVAPEEIADKKQSLRCGGPYVIPMADARAFGSAWIEAVDSFPPRTWEDVMYAFGLAAIKLGMPVTQTRMVQSNYHAEETLQGDVIHYCYGDEIWTKRDYFTEDQIKQVWEPRVKAPRNTVRGEILAQIHEAGEFYRTAARERSSQHTAR